jgi:uncharacterized surface protein with fasciclin (FAS1) repeats
MRKASVLSLIVAALLSIGLGAAQPPNGTSVPGTSAASILNASANAGSLSTFSTALGNAGIVGSLENSGIVAIGQSSYYLFAPTDAAFANYTSLGILMANQTDLRRVLSYHMAWSNVPLDLNTTKSLRTLEGENLTLSASNSGLTVNGARVLRSVSYDQGTIYLIDKVLLPKSTTDPAGMSVLDAVNSLGDAKKFASYLQSAGFVDRLNGQGVPGITGMQALSDGPFTVFAPSDAAFGKLSASISSAIVGSNQANLRTLMSYHVINNATMVSFNSTGTNNTGGVNYATLEGSSIVVDNSFGQVNGAKVLKARRYGNGVVYEIDQVLVPIRLSLGSMTVGSAATTAGRR